MDVDGRVAATEMDRPGWMEWQDVRNTRGDTLDTMRTWFEDYLMQPHPGVGRSGHVCPYLAPATRQNLARFTVSDLKPGETARLRRLLLEAVRLFRAIPCPPQKAMFRTVVIAFPAHAGPEGIAELETLQQSIRFKAAWHGLMIGLFEPDSPQPGIANRAFQSFRSPVAVLAVRTVVEGDAPFILRNPLMIPVYLARFGATGRRRLWRALKQRIRDKLGAADPSPTTV